jgi:hypothetical protein
MARKRYKKKRRTSSLSKPFKRGITPRWKDKDLERLRTFEKTRNRGGDWDSM